MGSPARDSQNTQKMALFIGESDITKPISDYGKMLKYLGKYREIDISVDL